MIHIDQRPVPAPVEIQQLTKEVLSFTTYAPVSMFAKIEGLQTLSFPFQGESWTVSDRITDPESVYTVRRVSQGTKTVLLIDRSDEGIFKVNTCKASQPDCVTKLPYRIRLDQEYTPAVRNEGGQLLLEADTKTVDSMKKLLLITDDDAVIPLDIPPGEPKPPVTIGFKAGEPPKVLTNDRPGLVFTGTKIGDVKQVVESGNDLKLDADIENKVLTVFLGKEQTDKPRTLTLQFRDAKGSLIEKMDLVVEARPGDKPER